MEPKLIQKVHCCLQTMEPNLTSKLFVSSLPSLKVNCCLWTMEPKLFSSNKATNLTVSCFQTMKLLLPNNGTKPNCKLIQRLSLHGVTTTLKEHVALDRSSWSIKSVWKPFVITCIWVESCFKSRIQWSTQICLEIAGFSFCLAN